MRRRIVFASMLALMSATTIWAENTQTVTISGSTVAKEVTALAFSGDNVTLTYTDGSQTEDMANVSIAFTYDSTTGISTISTDKAAEAKQGVYTIDGRYLGNSTAGLNKGLYIVNGKQTIIK